jgi:hypothetical protein
MFFSAVLFLIYSSLFDFDRFALDKKSALLPFLTTNGVNGVVANQRRVGGAFE